MDERGRSRTEALNYLASVIHKKLKPTAQTKYMRNRWTSAAIRCEEDGTLRGNHVSNSSSHSRYGQTGN